ncbi:FmdB family zinc ribbon protein [Pseudonocardia bannensis]|uniref:Zinc ribbon domain-containing protein n=1 Tax=Pseudonocardia bannensis TaxID=630973 RepID=A0A848DF64_9PSEU|nr:zinc ribbon domain-containing protein [Pseudonocardia bannensis]NMH91191.1 zinc ribbon domain-containing protein [Pseudonocardia bannensis]
MPTYAYHCPNCGGFDLVRPMSEVDAVAVCPGCGMRGRRVFGAPALRRMDARLRRALDAGERSADSPQVVTAVPPRSADRRPGRATRYTTDPRHARLPRP